MDLKGRNLIDKPIQVIDVDNYGKFMWIILRGDEKFIYILNNFGLTGEWSFEKKKNVRISFEIDDDTTLYFYDDRNFGLLEITTERKTLDEKINKLAPDILKTEFTNEEFNFWVSEYIKKSKKRGDNPIVKALLFQDKKDGIVSGIGNYLASEILYRAKISPHTRVKDLSKDRLNVLAETIRKVSKHCYITNTTRYIKGFSQFIEEHKKQIKNGQVPNYHPEIEINDDDIFAFQVYGRKIDKFDNDVKTDTIAGTRTTYWVPSVQK